jgi:hypothetical protein
LKRGATRRFRSRLESAGLGGQTTSPWLDRGGILLVEFLFDGGELAQLEHGEAQAAAAWKGVPNIGLSTGFSPKPLGTNSR